MNISLDSIDIYNDSAVILDKSNPRCVLFWTIILFILMFILLGIFSIPFNTYKRYSGYIHIENNESYLILQADINDFPINKNNLLYIKSDRYDYKVVNIERNNVIIKINLEDNIKIDGNTVLVNIRENRTTIFEIIKNKIRKGFL